MKKKIIKVFRFFGKFSAVFEDFYLIFEKKNRNENEEKVWKKG